MTYFMYVNVYTWPGVLDKYGRDTQVTATSLSAARSIAVGLNPANAAAYESIRPRVRRGVNLMMEEMG